MTRMNHALLLLATMLLIAADKKAEQGPPRPPELAVLERFVGTWDEEVTSKATEQNPKETKTTGVTTNE